MPKLTNDKHERFCQEYLIDYERFNGYIDKSLGEDACWNWTGAKCSVGYGYFHTGKSKNSNMLTHRIAYGLHTGKLKLPEAVCHHCDNPSCCNPSHLFGGTRADNNRDMMRKGRHFSQTGSYKPAQGEKHHQAKLLDVDIPKIRLAYANGEANQYELASQWGVSQRTINKIVNKEGWAHV